MKIITKEYLQSIIEMGISLNGFDSGEGNTSTIYEGDNLYIDLTISKKLNKKTIAAYPNTTNILMEENALFRIEEDLS